MRRVLIALVVLAMAREARADEPSSPQKGATPVPEAAAAPSATPTTDAQSTPKPSEGGGVFLHIASKETVTIEKDDTGEVVCSSPCDKSVPADTRYHIGGHRPSPSFVLAPASNGKADLHVKPGSRAGFWTGVGGVALGTALIGTGVAVLIVGVNNRNPVGGADTETTDNSFTDTMSIGTVMILGGVAIGLGGGAFLAANASTSIWGNVQKSAGSTRDAQPRTLPNARAVGLGPQALPRPTYVSIFSGTF
jgi:hypothetical protein